MKPKMYMSECGYYMLHQYKDYYVEFYSTISGSWLPQHGQAFAAGNKEDGQFDNFNDRSEGVITYIDNWRQCEPEDIDLKTMVVTEN